MTPETIDKEVNASLPFLVWVVVISTVIADISGEEIIGYHLSSVGWLIPLVCSLFILARNPRDIALPVTIWLPWCSYVAVSMVVSDAPNAVQRSIMLLCPLIVGMAVSKARMGENELAAFFKLMRLLAVGICIIVVIKAGILVTGILPMVTGMAAEVMTSALFCTFFAAWYASGGRKVLGWWFAMAVIPVIAVTRTAIVVAGLTLPLTFAPLATYKRVIILAVLAFIGLGIFYSPRMQQKMFYSGRGNIEDVQWGSGNLATHGRSRIWNKMLEQIEERPLLGYGANASEIFVARITRGTLSHPHNDWLRLIYDYGYVGTAVFAMTLLMQLVHILKRARQESGDARILLHTGASAFLVFALFMCTDNIILYAAFFGNLHFTILGLAYAASSDQANRYSTSLD